jgi:hypothetical protein
VIVLWTASRGEKSFTDVQTRDWLHTNNTTTSSWTTAASMNAAHETPDGTKTSVQNLAGFEVIVTCGIGRRKTRSVRFSKNTRRRGSQSISSRSRGIGRGRETLWAAIKTVWLFSMNTRRREEENLANYSVIYWEKKTRRFRESWGPPTPIWGAWTNL